MERPDHADETIENFIGVTGVSERHTAEHILGAFSWDLNQAVDFYFHNPAGGSGDAGGGGGQEPQLPPLGTYDDEMQEALAASMQQQQQSQPQEQAAGPRSHPPSDCIEIPDDDYAAAGDDEDAALMSLAQRRAAAVEAHREAERRREEDMMDLGDTAMRASGLPADFALAGRSIGRRHGPGGSGSEGPASAAVLPGSSGGLQGDDGAGDYPGLFPIRSHPLGSGDLDVDLPEGINVEEARMLEAAMLGVPYTGRMPTYGQHRDSPPVDPDTLAQRYLRQEQDEAFEESLAADRAKQESVQEAQRQAEEAAAALAAEEAAEAMRKEEAVRKLQQLLAAKAAALASEPAVGEGGTIQVVVRLPDGTRCSRRFRRTDPLSSVFDFIDVRCCGDGSGGSKQQQEEREGALQPGGYRLVTQFPRRVYEEGKVGSFEEAGITTDTAVFLEQA